MCAWAERLVLGGRSPLSGREPVRQARLCPLPPRGWCRVINSSRSAGAVGTGARHTRFISTLFPLRSCDCSGSVRTLLPAMRSLQRAPQNTSQKYWRKKQSSTDIYLYLLHSCKVLAQTPSGIISALEVFLCCFWNWRLPHTSVTPGSCVNERLESQCKPCWAVERETWEENKYQMVLNFLFQLALKVILCAVIRWSVLWYTKGFLSGALLNKQQSVFRVMVSNCMVWVAGLFLEMVWWHPFVVGFDIS